MLYFSQLENCSKHNVEETSKGVFFSAKLDSLVWVTKNDLPVYTYTLALWLSCVLMLVTSISPNHKSCKKLYKDMLIMQCPVRKKAEKDFITKLLCPCDSVKTSLILRSNR